MSVLPPNPSLVAIILLIKNKQGVKHIYHYPPHPGHGASIPTTKVEDEANIDDSSDSDTVGGGYSSESHKSHSSVEDPETSCSDNDSKVIPGKPKVGAHTSKKRSHEKGSEDIDESGSTSPEKGVLPVWKANKSHKELLGLPLGWPAFLCPPEDRNMRRFEMSIDQLTFLGWPCFAKEDGTWRTKRKAKSARQDNKDDLRSSSLLQSKKQSIDETIVGKDQGVAIDNPEDTSQGEVTGTEAETATDNEQEETSTSQQAGSMSIPQVQEAATATETGHEEQALRNNDDLKMFHVIFVMNPPSLEHQIRTEDMYTRVVKNFSKALRREQARNLYVSKECQKLKEIKARHDVAAKNVFKNSRLAKAIAILYNCISTSRIAHIDLTSHRTFWLQIPIPTSISSLPNPTEPQLPGVWLTTSTVMPTHDELATGGNMLASHFALLLLTDVQTILGSISENSPIRVALEHYLSHSTPTKSFLRVSQKAAIALEDITLMASHLIHWRQARVIPPLSKKDIYIVSPNADMRRLKTAAAHFQREFPLQPPLTKILASLQSARRPYYMIFPNKDHKEAYMDILAWLMRGGWVTQIRTFAWVRVPAHIQQHVREVVEREEKEALRKKNKRFVKSHQSHETMSTDEDEGDFTGDEADTDDGHHLMLSSTHSLARSTTSAISSPSSAITTVPLGSSLAHSGSSSFAQLQAILIPSPTKTSGLESRYLDHIASLIGQDDNAEARDAWYRCLPYFDGEHALEQIPVREGWKRNMIEGLRAGWVRDGWLREARSW